MEKTLEAAKNNQISVEIFGLGYVGFPLAVRLSNQGLNVLGIDTNQNRINRLERGELMDSEIHLKDQFQLSRNNKKLNFSEVPKNSELSKILLIQKK